MVLAAGRREVEKDKKGKPLTDLPTVISNIHYIDTNNRGREVSKENMAACRLAVSRSI